MASIFDPLSLSDDVTVFERAVALAGSLGDASVGAGALLARAHVLWLRTVSGGRDARADGIGARPANPARFAWRLRSKRR